MYALIIVSMEKIDHDKMGISCTIVKLIAHSIPLNESPVDVIHLEACATAIHHGEFPAQGMGSGVD